MRLRALEVGPRTGLALIAASLLWIVEATSSCGGAPAPAQDASKAAECAAVRAFYDDAQTKLIDKGACDASPQIEACIPHVALREALIASLEKAKCPSQTKP